MKAYNVFIQRRIRCLVSFFENVLIFMKVPNNSAAEFSWMSYAVESGEHLKVRFTSCRCNMSLSLTCIGAHHSLSVAAQVFAFSFREVAVLLVLTGFSKPVVITLTLTTVTCSMTCNDNTETHLIAIDYFE